MKSWVKVCLLGAFVVAIRHGVVHGQPNPQSDEPSVQPDGESVSEPLPEVEASGHKLGEQIEVLVLYTPHARDLAGSDQAIRDRINTARAVTNQAYQASQALVTLRFVREPLILDFVEEGLADPRAVIGGDRDDLGDECCRDRDPWGQRHSFGESGHIVA